MKKYVITIILIGLFLPCAGGLQAKEKEKMEKVEIPLIDTPPQIDGKLDDPVWSKAARFTSFKSFKPDYGKPGSEKTSMYLCSDRENFYFAARCFQVDASEIKGSITRRDNMFGDDWVAFCIDTFHSYQSAYAFLVNPLGIQGDGVLDAGGDLDGSHDMVWYSKGTIDDKGFTVEARIPFKSIRFPVKKETQMGVWMVRNIVRTSENLSFPGLQPDRGAILSQMQTVLVKDMKYKRTVELLPVLAQSQTQSHEAGRWGGSNRHTDIGFTGKLGLNPGLVLDTTVNPDFSQVEADAGQVDVNLRYDLFYPEKRPFFLEGIEEFKFAGNTEDAPLYSVVHTRRIIDPVMGLKLTGKMGVKNSLSTILAIDEPLGSENEPGTERERAVFGILRFRHALKKDSYIGGFYTGRDVSGQYNRVLGIDGRFRVASSAVTEYHLLGSFTNDRGTTGIDTGHALGIRYNYNSRRASVDIGLQDISRNFQVDTGFLTRQGITRLGVFGMYTLFPRSKFFQRIEPFYWGYHIRDKESGLFETFNLFTLRFKMPRNSEFRLDSHLSNEVFAGRRFSTSGLGFRAESQITKHLFFHVFYRHRGGIFYDPDNPFPGRTNTASISLEYQPAEKFNTGLDVIYSDFYRKSDSRKEYDYTIMRNRTTFQLNKYLFFRGIAEYNFFREKLLLDALASFTYIPGTVVHLGWGSLLEKTRWDNEIGEYVSSHRFREIRRGFFFKVSYLWRL
ncbi:MAG: carbohydrate binding family 9 domain-containing protein [bacterium]|nr:carbohydrate binding family 9 domain-containing protein [bacterium]